MCQNSVFLNQSQACQVFRRESIEESCTERLKLEMDSQLAEEGG